MKARELTLRLLHCVALTFFSFLLVDSPVCAQSDPPLTKRNITSAWETNPQQDAQAYIENTVMKRKVGFLPTEGIRRELRDHGVPREVIDALRLNLFEGSEFKFQVWLFESGSGGLSSSEITNLARAIIGELRKQDSNLSDVFTHFKPPLPEPCVQTPDGSGCPNSTGPLLQIKGNVEKSGNRFKAVVRLSYLNPSASQPIGEERVTIIQARNEAGLKTAAAEIVGKIHENIRQEVKEF